MWWRRNERRGARGKGAGPGERAVERDGTLRIHPSPAGVTLRALEGCLIVTQAGDREDHVLEAGAVLRLRGTGLVVAWALAPSRLEIGTSAGPRVRARRVALATGS